MYNLYKLTKYLIKYVRSNQKKTMLFRINL